jgi:NAD(P)-dependent dehydrogenase (short-subunit alcohol dehydrogenase family)
MSTRNAVLVTGASSGMGRACALRLSQGGFAVFAAVRSERAAQALRESGSPRVVPVILDVRSARRSPRHPGRYATPSGPRGSRAW